VCPVVFESDDQWWQTYKIERTLLIVSFSEPFHNTVHVKSVTTFPPHYRERESVCCQKNIRVRKRWKKPIDLTWRTVIARNFAIYTIRIEGHSTNPTTLVINIPFPFCDGVPFFNIHFECSLIERSLWWLRSHFWFLVSKWELARTRTTSVSNWKYFTWLIFCI
jgi:hypothetical protein